MRRGSLVAGPLLAIAILLFADLDPARPATTRTAAVAALMAVWWIGEAIPLAATALVPVVLLPFLGVSSGKNVASQYFNNVIFLFLGGFLIALAMQRWNLHRRIALRVLMISGGSARGVLAGFMGSTGFVSMWISNTAAAMMMVPIGLAVALELERSLSREDSRRFSVALFLGIAYAASIGGMATLVGTPPNLSFVRIFAIAFPEGPEITFAAWFLLAAPLSFFFLTFAWVYLAWAFCPKAVEVDRTVFKTQLEGLGPMSFPERVVLIDFALVVLLWVSRVDLDLGAFTIPGWSSLFPNPAHLDDGVVAISLVLPLFLIPSRLRDASGGYSAPRVLDWETAKELPWDIVLLFGGGFALATGFIDSGLSTWIGGQLQGLKGVAPAVAVGAICTVLTFLGELTSNTATTEMSLPVIAALSSATGLHPILLMVPATLACSCGFMLPVATPPNAIVFAFGRIKTSDMAKAGLVLNLFGIFIITVAIFLLGDWAFAADLSVMPDWATPAR